MQHFRSNPQVNGTDNKTGPVPGPRFVILAQLEDRRRDSGLQQRSLPLGLAKAHEHEVVPDHDRPLDQHAVLSE